MSDRLYFPDRNALENWLRQTKAGRALVTEAARELISEWRPQALFLCDFDGVVRMIASDRLRVACVDLPNLDYSGPKTAMRVEEYAALKTPQAYRWLLDAEGIPPAERRNRGIVRQEWHGARFGVADLANRYTNMAFLNRLSKLAEEFAV